ncbi:MAG: VanW family protein [Deltaproteobacteria bacterium]
MSGLLPAEVRQVVGEMAVRYQTLPREPSLEKESGRVISGRDGQIVAIQPNIRAVMEAPPGKHLKLRVLKIKPMYRSEDLMTANHCIGYYATGVGGNSQRHTNITLACEALNNTVIWPGQIFSFNDVVGPRTPERGYLPAPIILKGQHDIDYGGGVCQAASTIYNAMLESGLKLIERHAHSKPVPYVDKGRDATVGYGYMDLRFHNGYDYPVIIKAGMHSGKLEVQILGREKK